MSTLKDAITRRKSIRSFNKEHLSNEDLKKVEEIITHLDNPFDIPIEFKILEANENNLSSPVITGEQTYIAAKATPQELWEMAYGYEFEKLVILLEELGISTTILAATLKRKAFEEAMDLVDDEVMPAATPIGYAADKKSMREKLLRKTIKSDERIPFEELFYNKDFNTPLKKEEAGVFLEPLELMRLAPSAGNKQPWRAVIDGNIVHFYKDSTKNLGESKLGDVQKMDVGISLANFDLTAKENGLDGMFFMDNPNLETNANTEYMVSYKLKD